jgi:xylulokinase
MTSQRVVIGVDIGTQGVKAAAYDEDGTCLAEAFRKSDLRKPEPGTVEEDPEFQLASATLVIAECAARAGAARVKGIAIDGQMAGIIGVGEDGKNVTPYDSWLDTRCSPYITQMQKAAGRDVTAKAGGPPSFNHGPKILWWKAERPEVYTRIRAFVQPGGYAAMRLCGLGCGSAFIDSSYLHFSCFADSRRAAWDRSLCARFGVNPAVLPRIVDPHSVVGELSPAMAGPCGLAPGVPIVAGCGDTAASFLSCGAARSGICVDVAGTASVFAGTEDEFRADTDMMVLSCGHSATPGLWHPYAYINGGGMNLEWFRAELAGGARGKGASGPGAGGHAEPPSFDELNALADAVELREDDPIFIPHLGGRVSPGRPLLRGAWAGLAWSHGLGHLYRGVLEGVALEYGIYLGALEKLYGAGRVREVRVTGGGEKSAVWNQIKADVLGVPVVQIVGGGGAPMGAALLAAFGVGMVSDLEQGAARWVRTGAVTEPDPTRVRIEGQRLTRYHELLKALDTWSEAAS